MAKFNERLRQLRNARDLSQSEFAKQIKVSKSSVNMYERGEREPGFETLERIADYFNVDMDYLLGKSNIVNRFQSDFSCGMDTEAACKATSSREPRNIIRLAGRDGSYEERCLSDEQLAMLKSLIDQLPKLSEDI